MNEIVEVPTQEYPTFIMTWLRNALDQPGHKLDTWIIRDGDGTTGMRAAPTNREIIRLRCANFIEMWGRNPMRSDGGFAYRLTDKGVEYVRQNITA